MSTRRRKPKAGKAVVVRWIDSGLTQTGDPLDPRVGVLEVCETHGRVLSCESHPALVVRQGMDKTILKLATNSSGNGDKDVDVFSIWWPAVVSIKVLK